MISQFKGSRLFMNLKQIQFLVDPGLNMAAQTAVKFYVDQLWQKLSTKHVISNEDQVKIAKKNFKTLRDNFKDLYFQFEEKPSSNLGFSNPNSTTVLIIIGPKELVKKAATEIDRMANDK